MAGAFGKYQLVREVGQGTTGKVYLAHDPFRGIDVAVKIYATEDGCAHDAKNMRKMFFNEASMIGRLHHPNILPVLDAGEEQGQFFIAMENVPGARTLQEYSKPGKLLAPRDVTKAVFKCAKALHYASRHGVVHRDVKPSNVMLTLDSDVKLIDFGIAQNAQGQHSQIRDVAGSPIYMSPEQIKGERITHRSDLYSLGVMLFVLLTGERPFRARRLDELLDKIVHDAPRPISGLRPDLPEKLQAIVARAMHKDPKARFRDGGEFAADLFSVYRGLTALDDSAESDGRVTRLRHLAFFHDFSRPEIHSVLRVSEWQAYASGQSIVGSGEVEGGFYVLVSGNALVRRGERQLATLSPGDCFGEAAILKNAVRESSIEAIVDVEVLRVSAARVEQMPVPLQLRFSKTLLKAMVARLQHGSGLAHAPPLAG